MPDYLYQNRHGTWYFRCRVPLHLVQTIGQQEVKQSLKTGRRSVAVRRAMILAGQVFSFFEELEVKKGILKSKWNLIKIGKFKSADKELADITIDTGTHDGDIAAFHAITGSSPALVSVQVNQPASSITLSQLI